MIRLATRYDIKEIVKLVKEYAKESPCKLASIDENFNEQYISNLLFSLIVGRGFVVIDDEYKGFGEFDKVPYEKKYLHLLSDYKKSEFMCNELANKLAVAVSKYLRVPCSSKNSATFILLAFLASESA